MKICISVTGPAGCGKSRILQKIDALLFKDGWGDAVTTHELSEIEVIICEKDDYKPASKVDWNKPENKRLRRAVGGPTLKRGAK